MIAGLVVVIIIIVAVLQQYLKGTVIHAFFAFISVVLGAVIAFNYQPMLADFLVARGYGGVWASPASLILIFIAASSSILAATQYFLGADIHFSALPDKIISCILTALTATIACGVLLIAVGMTPIPGKWTYKRFNNESFNINDPSKTIIPADDIASRIFSTVSSGAFASSKYFSALQPNYINQIHLNKLGSAEGVLSIVAKDCLVVNKNSVWSPTQNFKDASNGTVIDTPLILIRVGIKSGSVLEGGAMDENGMLKFTLAQFRILAGENPLSANRFDSSKVNSFYPIGYVKSKDQIEIKRNLSEIIEMNQSEFKNHDNFGNVLLLDLAFELPKNYTPLAIAFRDSALAELSKIVAQEEIGSGINFVQLNKCSSNKAIINDTLAKIKPLEMTANNDFLLGIRLIADKNTFVALKNESTGLAIEKNNEMITLANLKVYPDENTVRNEPPSYGDQNYIPSILSFPEGFILVSLKCSVKTGADFNSEEFPLLVDMTGARHHPVGLIAGGKKAGQYIYQFDFCSINSQEVSGGLVFDENRVSSSFPKNLWLTSQTEEVFEVFFIYLLPTEPEKTIILSVQTGNQETAGFKDCEGFLAERKSGW